MIHFHWFVFSSVRTTPRGSGAIHFSDPVNPHGLRHSAASGTIPSAVRSDGTNFRKLRGSTNEPLPKKVRLNLEKSFGPISAARAAPACSATNVPRKMLAAPRLQRCPTTRHLPQACAASVANSRRMAVYNRSLPQTKRHRLAVARLARAWLIKRKSPLPLRPRNPPSPPPTSAHRLSYSASKTPTATARATHAGSSSAASQGR